MMSKQKSPDSELDAQRKRLAELLDRGLDDVEAGRIVSQDEVRRRMAEVLSKPLPLTNRRRRARG
jgi:predicted transcriptional regulator